MAIDPRATAVLDRLQRYLSDVLRSGALQLRTGNADGRVNSQDNERQISDALRMFSHSNDWFQQEGFVIDVAPPRYWYDFAISGPGIFFPVNVKVSSFKSADNLSSKEGLFYALTGIDPAKVSICNWERYCAELADKMGTNREADYYFLVINKSIGGEVLWTTLKSLAVLRSNGSNPPYQCAWSDNRQRVQRSFEEAVAFLLAMLKESFVKGANPLLSFRQHLDRYLEP